MEEDNSDSGELTEINVQVVPLEDNSGSCVVVEGIIPEATEELVQTLLSYCLNVCHDQGINFKELLQLSEELNEGNLVRDPSTLH